MSDEQDEMRDEIPDETIHRIVERLRPLPPVDPAARARVLVAVAAERERERERGDRIRAPRRRRLGWTAAAAVAAAVLGLVIMPRESATPGARTVNTTAAPIASGREAAPSASPSADAGAVATLAAHGASEAVLRPVQLVFRAPRAHHVSVVGDFSGWDPAQAVMTRDSGSGLWSVTLRLPAGRHVYAFLVDDSIWVRDPRAPSAPDADFGRPGSLLLVAQP